MKDVGYEIINLGGGKSPISLLKMIGMIEENLGKKAEIRLRPFHKADIKETWADITRAQKVLNWYPKIGLEEGLKRTITWYLQNKSWLKNVNV